MLLILIILIYIIIFLLFNFNLNTNKIVYIKDNSLNPNSYYLKQLLRTNNKLEFSSKILNKYIDIRYTQNSIAKTFRGGGSIHDTKQKLMQDPEKHVKSIPPIRVFLEDGLWWSIDNRRLWCFKEAKVHNIPVVIVDKSDKTVVDARKFTSSDRGKTVEIRT